MRWKFAALLLAACQEDPTGTPGPLTTVHDTGWFDVDPDPPGCTATIVQTAPVSDEAQWYWHAAPEVFVTEVDSGAFRAAIFGPTGQEVETELVWGEGLSFRVAFDGGLTPDAAHVLEVTDCSGTTRIPFHTARYGLPLVGGPESLDGKTWQLDLINADWVQPSGLGPILTLYFTTPVLLGVRFADEGLIDLLGAPGDTDLDGDLIQVWNAPTWEFPVTDFSDAPYVSSTSDNVVFEFSGKRVPVENFGFETTFAADGLSLGGTVLTGIADTRNLGSFANDPENPAAICDIAKTFGTTCIPCADLGPYCLTMEVRDVAGTLVPGLTLRTIE